MGRYCPCNRSRGYRLVHVLCDCQRFEGKMMPDLKRYLELLVSSQSIQLFNEIIDRLARDTSEPPAANS